MWERTYNGAGEFSKVDISEQEEEKTRAYKPKSETSHRGLDLCAPWEMVVGGNSGSWQGVVKEVVGVVARLGAEGEEESALVDMIDDAEAEEDKEGDLESTFPIDGFIVEVDFIFVGFTFAASTAGISVSRTGAVLA